MTNQQNTDVNDKVVALIDKDEIRAIPHRFARGLDRCDKALIQSCFHEDGTDDHGFFKGNAQEFCDWVMEELKKYAASQHIISTQNVELNGSSAVCESYFLAFHLVPTPDSNKEVIAAGRYLDTMEKRDGEWKISNRTCIFDWNRMSDESPLPVQDPDPRYTAKKFPDDDSYDIFRRLAK